MRSVQVVWYTRNNGDRASISGAFVSCIAGSIFVVLDTSTTAINFASSRFTRLTSCIPQIILVQPEKGGAVGHRVHRLLRNLDSGFDRYLRGDRVDRSNMGCRVSAFDPATYTELTPCQAVPSGSNSKHGGLVVLFHRTVRSLQTILLDDILGTCFNVMSN